MSKNENSKKLSPKKNNKKNKLEKQLKAEGKIFLKAVYLFLFTNSSNSSMSI
jgi:hypothetical protein